MHFKRQAYAWWQRAEDAPDSTEETVNRIYAAEQTVKECLRRQAAAGAGKGAGGAPQS